MKIVRLEIDENSILAGIDAMALVEAPAIQEDFYYFASEKFEETYLDSEEYYKQNANNSTNVNTFSPSESESKNGTFIAGYNNPYINWNSETTTAGYPIYQESNVTQKEWIQNNSLYNKKEIVKSWLESEGFEVKIQSYHYEADLDFNRKQ